VRQDYQALLKVREGHIATLLSLPASSGAGLVAKATVLKSPDIIGWGEMQEQIAGSLADDLLRMEPELGKAVAS
jgi:hypothetical protein